MPTFRARDRGLRFTRTPDQVAFANRMNAALQELAELPDAYMQGVLQDLVDTRARIAEAMIRVQADPDGLWRWHHLHQIDTAVYDALDRWSRDMVARMDGALATSWELGAAAYSGALGEAGVPVAKMGLKLPNLFRHQLQIAQAYDADLVKNISRAEQAAIMKEVRRGITGELYPHEIQRNILHLIDKPARPGVKYGRLSYQARRIVHTELKRVFNMANNAQLKHVAGRLGYDGAWKIWLHSGQMMGARADHRSMDRVQVPVREPFDLAGYLCEGPYDPVLPAEHIVNCKCTSILWYDRWGEGPPEVNRYWGRESYEYDPDL